MNVLQVNSCRDASSTSENEQKKSHLFRKKYERKKRTQKQQQHVCGHDGQLFDDTMVWLERTWSMVISTRRFCASQFKWFLKIEKDNNKKLQTVGWGGCIESTTINSGVMHRPRSVCMMEYHHQQQCWVDILLPLLLMLLLHFSFSRDYSIFFGHFTVARCKPHSGNLIN